ncbi:LacI family transcriptional regulator [Bradyrhizobium sacchari]|uniref:Ribose transport system substrate-binding protein n=1 Tax=Bradyrhizobium sacchari TaxID=1399419 RepID=A0A560JTP3_9BRAD|nr:sugar ABC transporter substrate-binding protein [Bradyrhizobium sacchari]OPY97031.1 LacI family transcriptional regulator [Bradyrhizobium sacchari]TWB58776.1 ribose transport system substrate-binding protein [Bradyrhizobium sacchari]TWB72864.1 ribose transport system substrate-binding protein [Bradyrhizobium sacchari]
MKTRHVKHLRLLSAALISCGLSAAPALAAGEVIAAFTKNQVDPHFEGVRAGVEQMAKKMNATIRQYVPTKPNNITEGMSQLEDVGVTRPNLVLFMPIDPKAQLPTIKRLIESGTPVLNYNDKAGDAPYLAFVGQDDYKLGYDIAKMLFDHLGGKGNVVILEGIKGSNTGDERKRGFDAALKEYPNIKLLASQPANFQRLLGLQVMENLIQQHSEINGVIAAADASALGAAEALKAAGRGNVAVVSINGVPEAVEAVKNGGLLAIAEFNGFKIGCVATEIGLKAIRGEAMPKRVVIPGAIITKANHSEWLVPFQQRTCPAAADYAGH